MGACGFLNIDAIGRLAERYTPSIHAAVIDPPYGPERGGGAQRKLGPDAAACGAITPSFDGCQSRILRLQASQPCQNHALGRGAYSENRAGGGACPRPPAKNGKRADRRISAGEQFKDVHSSPARGRERTLASHPSLKQQALLRPLVYSSLPLGKGAVLEPCARSGSPLRPPVPVPPRNGLE